MTSVDVLTHLWGLGKVTGSHPVCLVRLPFGRQVGFQGVGQELAVGGFEVARDDLVVVDVEPLEDTLVELPATKVVGLVNRPGMSGDCLV